VLRERRQRIALELALREANRTLEARVAERTAALESARAQLSRFAAEQERAIEAERRRLSREVHDQIGQVFTALKLILASLPRTDFPPGQAEALDRALEMGIASTRRVTAVLRPPLLDDLGLGAALRHFAEDLGRAAGLAVTVDIADDEGLDEVARLGLFRIAQEAVTNVLRHAAAAKLEISGRRDGDAYLFCIADDGRGYDPATVRPGAIGIVGMRERAALLGAQCAIAAAPGDGVAITLRLPLRQNAGGKPTDESRNEHPAG
jgi:signal transduction histidine kinase